MTSLVIGANGLVGRAVMHALHQQRVPAAGTYRSRPEPGLEPLDITDSAALARIIDRLRPACVYHCANSAGGVDFCEREPARAGAFHVDATTAIAQLCAKAGARLVFISSDYVFADREEPADENVRPAPLNVYGTLKLAAERSITAALPRHTIARTTNVYGWDPATATPNFVMNLYRTLAAGQRFRAPSYLWGTPTYAPDLAAALIMLAGQEANGTFHAVGPDYLDRYRWALLACEAFGMDASSVEEVAASAPAATARPARLRLATKKIETLIGQSFRGAREGLAAMAEAMRQEAAGQK